MSKSRACPSSSPRRVSNPAAAKSIVQLVDVFPALCDLTGAPAPSSVEGKSLVPILRDSAATVHEAAFSYLARNPAHTETLANLRQQLHQPVKASGASKGKGKKKAKN